MQKIVLILSLLGVLGTPVLAQPIIPYTPPSGLPDITYHAPSPSQTPSDQIVQEYKRRGEEDSRRLEQEWQTMKGPMQAPVYPTPGDPLGPMFPSGPIGK